MGVRPSLFAAVTASLLAATAAADEITAVYVGEPASADTSGRVAAMMALLSPSVRLSTPPRHLDELLDHDGLAVFGAGITRSCTGERLDAATYRENLTGLYRAIWETDNLDPLFEQAHDWETCLDEAVEPGELARVSYVEGVMAHEYGNTEKAREAFGEVFAIDPSYAWESSFGPGAQQLFNEVAASVASAQTSDLTIVAEEGSTVRVDGREVPGGNASLLRGRHIVQLTAPEEAGTRSVAIVVTGVPVAVIDPRAMGFDDGGRPGPAFHDAVSALFRGLQLDGRAPGYLVQLGKEAHAWQWSGQALVPLKVSRTARVALAPAPEKIRGQPSPAAPIMVAVGSGLLAGGIVLAAVAKKDLDEFDAAVEAGELFPFPADSVENPEDYPLYVDWQAKNARVNAGYALITAGGATLVMSVPVAVISANADRKRRELELTARLLPGPSRDGRGIAVNGFMLGLTLR